MFKDSIFISRVAVSILVWEFLFSQVEVQRLGLHLQKGGEF